jgi:hypothetical protein
MLGFRSETYVFALFGLAAAWTLGCTHNSGSSPPAVERARVAIVLDQLSRMPGENLCIQWDTTILRPAVPLSPQRVDAVLADLEHAVSDPPASFFTASGRSGVVPISACPEATPIYWWHIRAGRLRVLSDTRVEMVISSNLEGFPTVELCGAEVIGSRWKPVPCSIVYQG